MKWLQKLAPYAIAFAALCLAGYTHILAQTDPPTRTTNSGEAVYHDRTILAQGDNPNPDAPSFIQDCTDTQGSGGRLATLLWDTIINENCNHGIYTPMHVVITGPSWNGPQLKLRRDCTDVGCGVGVVTYNLFGFGGGTDLAAVSTRIAALCNAVLFPHGNCPSTMAFYTTDNDGVYSSRSGVDMNTGILVYQNPGKLPQCEIPSEGNAQHQPAHLFWDSAAHLWATMLPYPDCSIHHITFAD